MASTTSAQDGKQQALQKNAEWQSSDFKPLEELYNKIPRVDVFHFLLSENAVKQSTSSNK